MPSNNFPIFLLAAAFLSLTAGAATKKPKVVEPSPLERYIQDAMRHTAAPANQPTAGSLWTPTSRFTDLATDVRAAHVDDLSLIHI